MKPDFSKDLLPAIVQNYLNGEVLMLGYMNEAAYHLTLDTKLVTFYSRSKSRIWVKGETSGNYLDLVKITTDCDADAILVQAIPRGVTCHKGTASCFPEAKSFLFNLEEIINSRKQSDSKNSYTKELFDSGLSRITQKLGEEAVEVVIESISQNTGKLKEECSDLLYHLIVLLAQHDLKLQDIVAVLLKRQQP